MTLRDQSPLLLHNPNCSKSRAAKALLEARAIEFRERLYLEDPLDRTELEELAELLGLHPHAWTRARESAYAETGLGTDSSVEEHFEAMRAHPVLMERPILIHANRAAIGRPTENLAALLDD